MSFYIGRQQNGFRYSAHGTVNGKPAFVTNRGDSPAPTDQVYFLYREPANSEGLGRYVAVQAHRTTDANTFQNTGHPRFRTRYPLNDITSEDWVEWQVWDNVTDAWSTEFQWHQVTR